MSGVVTLENGWVENTDPSSGRKYYANTITGKTQWTRPEDAGGSTDGDWEAKTDPSSGRTYYVNRATNETSWTKPGSKQEWISQVDPASGNTYYINMQTQETSWTKPAGFDEKAESGGNAGGSSAASSSTAGASQAAATTTAAKPAATAAAAAAAKDDAPAAPAAASGPDKFAKIRDLRAKKAGAAGGAAGATASPASANPTPSAASGEGVGEAKISAAVGDHAATGARGAAHMHYQEADVDIGEVPEHLMEDWAKPVSEGGMGKFHLDRKGIFNKRTKLDKILSWKKDLIRSALLKLNSAMSVEAVQAFKNVVSFMGDRTTRKDSGGHAQKLMKNTLHAPEELRDEIFCQIIKQTTNNPNPESCVKGWQLMAIAAGVYPPSAEFEPYLMYYCQQHVDHPNYGPLARSVQKRIRRIMEQGPRVNVPTDVEIEAVKDGKPVIMRVHMLDGTFAIVPVQSWTTVKEMHSMVSQKLQIKNPEPFAIYEISHPSLEERNLDENERVLDIVAYWQKTFDDDKAKNRKHDETYHFLFKVRLFLDPDPADIASMDLFYIQGVHDVVNARYPTNEQDTVTLAALQAQEEHGDYAGNAEIISGKMGRYVSKKFIDTPTQEQAIEDRVLKVWQTLAGKGYSSRDSRANYLEYIKSWKIYGSTYYVVEPQNSRDFPKEVVLAINAHRILIVHPSSQEFLAEYPYDEVVTWGQSSKSFVLVTGNLVRQQKVCTTCLPCQLLPPLPTFIVSATTILASASHRRS